MRQTKIIASSNQKGGQGKSSTCVSVGCILASKGFKVLLVDLDAQASLTNTLLSGEFEENIYTAFVGKSELPEVQVSENLYVVPSTVLLNRVERELANEMAREYFLSDLLKPIQEKYDFIFLDCPPSLGFCTLNAFTAATHVIIPLIPEVLPLQGLKKICDFYAQVTKRLNPNLELTGILINRWENVNLYKEMEATLRERYADKVFKTKIRKNVSIAESPLGKKDITAYNPKSNGARDFVAFTEELLSQFKM